MCTISMIGTDWAQRTPLQHPWAVQPNPQDVTRAEFDALRLEMEALRKLLVAAKEYDTAIGQPDCEMEEKVELIKRLADLVGVGVSDIFAP